jgi:signal transduction histidine kinase
MIRKRRWLWVLLFIGLALSLGALATGWNIVLVLDYRHFISVAKSLSLQNELDTRSTGLIIKMLIGTLGFVAVLAMTILLFIKLLNEMRLNQLQSEFLATVSHELKTPLATLELCSSMVRSADLSEEEKNKLWASHQAELKRLKSEVEALLEAARWQSKPLLSKKQNLHLETWLTTSLAHWNQILGTEAKIERQGAPLDTYAFVDVRSFNLIVDNLMTNAKKFSREKPHVVIRTHRIQASRFSSKHYWKIEFEDFGWGFDPPDEKRIFHRFYRSKNEAPYAIAGTGLGLYLAGAASRSMKLRIHGRSKGLGNGAVFSLEGKEITP